jgi:hypothetical protein
VRSVGPSKLSKDTLREQCRSLGRVLKASQSLILSYEKSRVSIGFKTDPSSGADWHKRLLDRMSQDREGRPHVLTPTTASSLREFLGFRHIVRNLYGFELDPERVAALVRGYPAVWSEVKKDK